MPPEREGGSSQWTAHVTESEYNESLASLCHSLGQGPDAAGTMGWTWALQDLESMTLLLC